MLTSLVINNFRNFSALSIERLSRVNLFVGANNTGKTSILEAVEIFGDGGTPRMITKSTRRRGEIVIVPQEDRGTYTTEVNVSHLFHGHKLRAGAQFSILGELKETGQQKKITCEVIPAPLDAETSQQLLPIASTEPSLTEPLETGPLLAIQIKSDLNNQQAIKLPLTSSGGLAPIGFRRASEFRSENTFPVNFMAAEEYELSRLDSMWDAVVLTPEEEQVVQALNIIEPSIERIAFITRDRPRYGHIGGGIFVKLKNSDDRIPLGSMGDGLKHLLVLSLHLIQSSGGYLLVDEIDTGLHYSVLNKMWAMILETAIRKNIQVFATTHSLDCVAALGELHDIIPHAKNNITLHRVERGSNRTIVYNAKEISTAVKHHMELR